MGILKRRFWILLLPPAYSLEVQSKILAALCVVHNFIRTHDPLANDDDESDFTDEEDDNDNNHGAAEPENVRGGNRNNAAVHEMRDHIADAMWIDYVDLRRRQLLLWSDNGGSDLDEGSSNDD